jgi:rhodanese-related sulfurtransferase
MGLSRRQDDTTDVSPQEARRLAAEENVLLLDVREPSEWAAGHAAGATHMPLGALRPDQLPPGRVVVAVCRSGNRSGKAVAQLSTAGVAARNMAGGMSAWSACGLPVVRDGGGPGIIA